MDAQSKSPPREEEENAGATPPVAQGLFTLSSARAALGVSEEASASQSAFSRLLNTLVGEGSAPADPALYAAEQAAWREVPWGSFRFVLETLLIALLHVAIGCLSLMIPASPGHETIFFAPTGVALAAMLWRDVKALPGILFGSLALLAAVWRADGFPDIGGWALTLAPVFCVQAWLASRLMRRMRLYPGTLDTTPHVLLFLAIVAPVSALLEPFAALTLLLVSGLSLGVALPVAVVWWLGGICCTMLLTPALLVCWGLPRTAWSPRLWQVLVPSLMAAVLSALAASVFVSSQQMMEKAAFESTASHHVEHFGRRLDEQVFMLQDLAAFVETLRGKMTPQMFQHQLAHMQKRYPELRGVYWLPMVPSVQREEFEARMRVLSGQRDFQIITSRADEASFLLPIAFASPPGAGRLGEDVLDDTRMSDAVTLAIRLEEGAAARIIGNGEMVYFFPVAGDRQLPPRKPGGPPSATLTPGVAGLVMAVVDLQALAEEALVEPMDGLTDSAIFVSPTSFDSGRMDWCLFADDGASVPLAASLHCKNRLRHASALDVSYKRALMPGGQRLVVVLYMPGDGAPAGWDWLWPGGVFGMLVIVALVAAFLLISAGHAREHMELAAARATELTRTKQQQPVALSRMQLLSKLAIWEYEPATRATICSDEFFTLFGLSPGDDVPDLRQVVQIFSSKERHRFVQMLNNVRQSLYEQGQDFSVGGRVLHVGLEGDAGEDGKLCRLVLRAQDVTMMRKTEEDIRQMALLDPLTKLPNRSYWQEQAAKAVQRAAREQTLLAIIFVDLDHFKNINDSLGHAEGDRLLKTVSERLGRALRQGDVLGRQGGDEFVVVLPSLQSQENAAEVAQRMLTELSEPVMLGITEFTISASLGIAVFPEDGNDVTTLLKHADTAMYAAKEDGRNNFRFFVQEMNDRVHQQVILENGMRRALRDDEFTLLYQPQIEYSSGRVVGVEALLRWPHPELGNIPPDRFIPVAENCGLIDQLGRWVLRAAFTQQRLWSALGYENLLVSINVSALQLARPDFVEQVQQLLQQTRANPTRIDLEITETAIRDANETLFQRLDELVNMGLSLSLDDFGTGYSGLGALKGLPLHRIKLDRSFIHNLPDDIENAAITTASLAMASALGLDVVAEGVETAEHRDFLASYGCRFMQGYFFARPMSADDFIACFPPDRVI